MSTRTLTYMVTMPDGSRQEVTRRASRERAFDYAEAYRLRAEGMAVGDVAIRFGVTIQAIRDAIRKHCKQTGASPILKHASIVRARKLDYAEAYRLRSQKYSYGRIADRFGVTAQAAILAVQAYAKANGLAVPGQGKRAEVKRPRTRTRTTFDRHRHVQPRKFDYAEAARLAGQGMTKKELAAHFAVSETAMRRALRVHAEEAERAASAPPAPQNEEGAAPRRPSIYGKHNPPDRRQDDAKIAEFLAAKGVTVCKPGWAQGAMALEWEYAA